MAAKYQLITELYRRTGVAVAKNPQAWQGFLSSACRNYKCRFDEQLLIYAQRPDAVAVAKLETWNRQFKRWVNKDSKGIAVFDPKGRRNTLKYYFDVSDTHEGYYGSRPVPIWQMDERYEQAVMERLSDRFGDVESTDLASALMETAKNAVEDNLQDYFSQLKDCTKDSFLEELDDFNIEVIYRRLAANSVAFMLISRCGLDTNEFFDREDFADIINFNTPATINAIGVATSDIAEMALREISQSIRNVQMAEKDQNRTFAQRTQAQYDKGRQQPERSEYNERNHLQQTGGLSYSRPNITDRARASAWQVRFDAQGLSGEAQASDLSQPADIGQAEWASARGRADSTPEVGAFDEAALSRAGRDRGTERESTDAVGRTDEQHPQPSGGSDTDRTDLQVSVAKDDEVRVNLPTVDEQIEMIAEAEDEKASAFAISKEDIDSVLQKGSGVADGKYRIYRQFQKGEDRQKNIEFLKNEYGTGGGTHIFPDGFSGHSWHDSNACVDNVYRIWEEHADTKATQLVFCDLSTPKNDGTFNVYDDMREKLIARGIPAEQIRFIHEATTDAQKKELFGKVRSGEVRVLFGSTPKMGAGTNVQDRLIAIHNLDCPWRPSDLEQRQGRIERQGNMFPEVEVYRYVTEQTFDAYLYQLVESKQKFISQIMTSKSPVRSAEDVDEVALSFAEVKMLATGDARFKEKMDLDIQVSKLRVLKQSYLSEHYDLEDRVLKYYPQTIKEYEERIAGYENDAALAEQHKPQGEDKFCPMTLTGVTYTEKADAGEMLLAICKDYPMSAPTEIGSYRGFRMEIYYDTVNAHYCMNLCGKAKHKVDLGADALGNLTRIENELSKLPARLEAAKTKKAETIVQLETAKEEIKKPFAFEDELKEKTERLNALNIELNLNEKDISVMDTEPEQTEEQPERKCASRER